MIDRNAEWLRFTPEGHAIIYLLDEIEKLKKENIEIKNKLKNIENHNIKLGKAL